MYCYACWAGVAHVLGSCVQWRASGDVAEMADGTVPRDVGGMFACERLLNRCGHSKFRCNNTYGIYVDFAY
jgi:hypothetical protein